MKKTTLTLLLSTLLFSGCTSSMNTKAEVFSLSLVRVHVNITKGAVKKDKNEAVVSENTYSKFDFLKD